MQCLECTHHHTADPAVALCAVCQASMCAAHATPYHITTYSLQPGGMVPVRRPNPEPVRVYLCPQCAVLMRRPSTGTSSDRGRHAGVVEKLNTYGRRVEERYPLHVVQKAPALNVLGR
jgi:hypothetical protein